MQVIATALGYCKTIYTSLSATQA